MRKISWWSRRGSALALLTTLLLSTGMLQSRPCDTCPVMNFGPVGPPTTGGTTCPTGKKLYKFGVTKSDITGPAAEVGMMGYADGGQITHGIHMRLWSRAFAMQQCKGGRILVFVSADLGQMFQSIHQGVMKKLYDDKLGAVLNASNVILSATHTHNGPGGYSHRALYNLTTMGYNAQNYNAIVAGITESIKSAYNKMKADTYGHEIYFKTVSLPDASFNRSSKAYMANPVRHFGVGPHDKRDKTSRTLTFVRYHDKKITGLINWFGVHPTNIGKNNKLITGDSKGYAAWKMEHYNPGMIAAFAQGAEGDMSPNFNGVPGGNPIDFWRMRVTANKQHWAASVAMHDRSRRISGPIKSAMRFVYMPNVWVDKQYTGLSGSTKLCQPAIGFSMLAGSTEDGPGLSFISEGFGFKEAFDLMTSNAWIGAIAAAFPLIYIKIVPLLAEITPTPVQNACHAEKPIAAQTGARNGHPAMTEVHVPIMVSQIGQFTIVPVPFECTVTCGKRLGSSIAAAMGSPADHYAIAGLSNGYSGYVTTREEYALQHYEGASVHFGPWTHAAYMQLYKRVANHLMGTDPLANMPATVQPPDLSGIQFTLQTGVVMDDTHWAWRNGALTQTFGWPEKLPHLVYQRPPNWNSSVEVEVKFRAGHPKNNLKRGSSFLYVQRFVNGKWVNHRTDNHPSTRYYWFRVKGTARSTVTIKWFIGRGDPPGRYRIRHDGNHKTFWGQIYDYHGISREFTVL